MPSDLTVTGLLARLTGKTVANLGMSAYGPQQELAVLRRYALPLRPRAIVWAIYEGNDLRDLRRYDQAIAAGPSDGGRPASPRLARSFGANAPRALSRLLSPCRSDPDAARRRSGVLATADGRSLRMYFLHRSDPFTAEDRADVERIAAIIGQGHDTARGRGAALVVVLIPTSFRVHKDVVRCEEPSACGQRAVNDFPDRLRRLLAERAPGAHYLDLTPAFVEQARRGEVTYRPDDLHWDAPGHRVAAESIASELGRLLASLSHTDGWAARALW
jgi:lysophospholipase L1-like esterase